MDEIQMDETRLLEPEAGTNWFRIAVGLVVVISIIACLVEGLAWYKRNHPGETPPPVEAPAATAPAPAESVPQSPVHPLEQAAPALPTTPEAGDAALLAELSRLTGTQALSRWIRPANLVRHVVATVDALPRRQVPQQVVPTTPVPGHLVVEAVPGGHVISAENFKRYLPWMHLLLSVEPTAAAGAYRHFYPLFQQAYQDLGYPKGYFNDRLIAAIDDVLEAPEMSSLPRVESPSVMWRYDDPELEALSAGQKILLRIGPVNAKAVRGWLVAFRAKIA
jgi:hypothetical protein